jgi:hypothetical protein
MAGREERGVGGVVLRALRGSVVREGDPQRCQSGARKAVDLAAVEVPGQGGLAVAEVGVYADQ